MTACLIPVKELSTAMSRLGDILKQDDKIALSLAMLEDVVEVVSGVSGISPLVIVTRDPRAAAIADKYGIEVIQEPLNVRGEGPAVDYGADTLTRRGVDRLLVIPSDIPQVEASDIEAILAVDAGVPSVVIAPAHDGGTNAMFRKPPMSIPSRFGPNSLALHLQEAKTKGVDARIIELNSLYVDVDTPEDLASVLIWKGPERTRRFVESVGLSDKLPIPKNTWLGRQS